MSSMKRSSDIQRCWREQWKSQNLLKIIMVIFISIVFVSKTVKAQEINQKCRVFSCGQIDHTGETEETRSCILAQGDTSLSVPAESNYYCTGIYWYKPEAIKPGKQFCIKKLNPTPFGIVLPGDICNANSECYGNNDGDKCILGKCKSSSAEGEDCSQKSFNFPDHKKCADNYYCAWDTKKCTPTLKEGDDCSDIRKQCASGLICIGSENGEAYKCSSLFKGKNGDRFRINKVNNPPFVGQQAYCSSYNYFTLDSNTTLF